MLSFPTDWPGSQEYSGWLSLSEALTDWIDRAFTEKQNWLQGMRVLGPVSPPIEKINLRHRKHIFMFSTSRSSLKPAVQKVSEFLKPTPSDFRLKVDMDPYHFQ